MRPKRLKVKQTPGMGVEIHGDIPDKIAFPEGTMKATYQPILIGDSPWMQFPVPEWTNMLTEVFQEMVDLWNEKYAESND